MTPSASRLQQEIKQTRPFRSVSQEVLVGLMKTADLVHRQTARILDPEGITVQQYNVLRILRGAGEEGLPTLEITTRMIEQTPGITRLIDRLEAKRLVSRERCPTDRRQVTCRISEKGIDLLRRLDPVIDRSDDARLPLLTAKERQQLVTLLDRGRAGLERNLE